VSFVLALAALGALTPVAGAVALPEFLVQSPEGGVPGSGAGQLDEPDGVAVDPNLPGNVYVADSANNRIDVFSPWGVFVQAFGWGVRDGQVELETCSLATGCLAGLAGSGAGQIERPQGVAVDSAGDVYVVEGGKNFRVQKFDAAGGFLFMFGGQVNRTAVEEGRVSEEGVCPAVGHPADVCRSGVKGNGVGQLGAEFYSGRFALSPLDGTIFLGETENKRIQEFNADGTYKEEIAFSGKGVNRLAVDKDGNLYADFLDSEGVSEKSAYKFSPAGPTAKFLAPSFTVEHPEATGQAQEYPTVMAVDTAGDLYLSVVTVQSGVAQKVLEFDASGTCLDCGSSGEEGESGFARPTDESGIEGIATAEACGPTDVYTVNRANGSGLQHVVKHYLAIFGPPPNPASCPVPVRPPEIVSQYAISADRDGAVVQAQINPKFWSDTRYYVEYGLSPCSEGGCQSQPASPGSLLTGSVVNASMTTGGVSLNGLTPGTTYHYRFVASSGGGGPVYGEDQTFTTFSAIGGTRSCPLNEAFRVGPSAFLPDCRAYEMVSPVEKEGSDVVTVGQEVGLPKTLDQSAVSGDRLSYGSYRAFGDAKSAPFTSQYIASRGAGGWVSHGISSRRERIVTSALSSTQAEVTLFSPDLCSSWLKDFAEPLLAPGAVEGRDNLYRRQDNECGGENYEAVTKVKAPHSGGELAVQGVSADGSKAVYGIKDNLTKAAPNLNGEGLALYFQQAGEEEPPVYVCILPDGKAITGACSAGVGLGTLHNPSTQANLHNAMSADGSRVYWTAYPGLFGGDGGQLYLRENPGEPQSALSGGVCVEAEKACTLAVSKEAEEASGGEGSEFWWAARDGSRAIFTVLATGTADDLYEFDLSEAKDRLIAHKVLGVMGASEDASYVYFASEEALTGANAQGASPVAEQANVYLYHEGGIRFVGTLAKTDVDPGSGYTPIWRSPAIRRSRVSPDGLHAVFMSAAKLIPYDNTDVSGRGSDAEVYVYDATSNSGAGRLTCASCNPTGARPVGGQVPTGATGVRAAALIPRWPSSLYASRALSDDGSRVFFDSFDALSPEDSNGVQDVYEWEAPGTTGCSETDADYSKLNEGCVSLISSGHGSSVSEFVDASPNGDDVFFSTGASLVGQDTGLVDIYDARVDGGFPSQPSPPAGCEGEACQSLPATPTDLTPSSLVFSGAGNLLGEPPPAVVRPRAKAPSRAQKLTAALRACRHRPKRRRAPCEAQARKRYAVKGAAKTTSKRRGDGR
jgi:sugar lactone lactonase YvrE